MIDHQIRFEFQMEVHLFDSIKSRTIFDSRALVILVNFHTATTKCNARIRAISS